MERNSKLGAHVILESAAVVGWRWGREWGRIFEDE
jgi:hypothetical protein